jgi:hypothetical protein
MSVNKLALSAIFALACTTAYSPALAKTEFLTHRAIYDVKLIEADERSGVEAMAGKMVYEFTGAACKGYTTDFRFVTTIASNSATQISDQRSKSFEDPDSQTLVFSTQTYTDEKLDKDLEGTATQQDGVVSVDIRKPEGRDISLGQAVFPLKHMRDLLLDATLGKKMTQTRIFDASDDADEIMVASTLIGKASKPAPDDAELKLVGKNASPKFWPITTTYHKTPAKIDSLPEYQMSMVLHENGVTRDITMRYTGFSLKATMTGFEALPQESCQ